MTKRHKRTKGLKALLLTASVIATIGGARLLDVQEPGEANSNSQNITVVEPAASSSFSALTQSGRSKTIVFKPIPQAMAPNLKPVARTRSSM